MSQVTTIRILAADPDGGEELRAPLAAQPGWDVAVLQGTAGAETADMLLLDLGSAWEQRLAELGSAPWGGVPMIAIGPSADPRIMRRAMQAGARDYLIRPLDGDELIASVRSLAAQIEPVTASNDHNGELTAVINAKGGSGASFLASNLAHILAADHKAHAALLDMDLQFGCLPLALDLHVRDTIFDALAAADGLDPVALEGFMAKHESGLHVLGSATNDLPRPWEMSLDAIAQLLQVACSSYDHVIVDLPRQIDPLTSLVLEHSERILLVMQQSVPHLHDARRMHRLLTGHLGVPADRVHVVVNRHQNRSPVSLMDIQDAVAPQALHTVANDYAHVVKAMNIGVPVYTSARGAPATKSLVALTHELYGRGAKHAAPSGPRRKLAHVLGI